jgi:hypothetical protein
LQLLFLYRFNEVAPTRLAALSTYSPVETITPPYL